MQAVARALYTIKAKSRLLIVKEA